uniref:Uncharacterized protein n=1 Tax=Cannabis sativa TaxID=3483 RepID=A0A803R3V1_CANSA
MWEGWDFFFLKPNQNLFFSVSVKINLRCYPTLHSSSHCTTDSETQKPLFPLHQGTHSPAAPVASSSKII